jgi:pimeloyl-ACP methyl ester carboxylesterase
MTRLRLMLAAFALAAGGAAAQTLAPCPESAPRDVKCYGGLDANAARYLIAIPPGWNQVLVVHPHAEVALKPPTLERAMGDLDRWRDVPAAGYAWAGTVYRRAGYGVTSAAEDADNLRRIFIEAFGAPRRVIIHGQGWGANVAAKAIELHPKSYDGAFLTSGFVAGATRGHDYRIDLRVVFEYYCGKLPADPKLTTAELRVRVNECTGSGLPTPRRSEKQKRNLADILAASRIPERTLVAHLSWGTLVAADIIGNRLDGRNPFSTVGVEYRGTRDDRALNAGVVRLRPDLEGLARFSEDGDLTGRVSVPVLTLHGIGDPTAFVEQESAYRAAFDQAGTSASLMQLFTDEKEHANLNAPEYIAALNALLGWIDTGKRPALPDIAAACENLSRSSRGDPCRFNPAFQPQPWESRVYPRQR